MRLGIATYFTSGWTYSIDGWLEHVHAATEGFSGDIILSTDHSQACAEKVQKVREKMKKWQVHHCQANIPNDKKPAYKEDAQFIIAKIQGAAFSMARDLGLDQLWSVESDVLVPPNALRVARQALEFDDGYYGVAMVTYHNGQFLGGRGSTYSQIFPDVYDDERVVPAGLRKKIKKLTVQMRKSPSQAIADEIGKLHEEVRACPPSANTLILQGKKWRRRGWMDAAYPGIGRGAILPTDWVGLGCTLLGKKALSLATFEGYGMLGTQDLFLCWKRWNQHDVRMCVIPHIACAHVKKTVGKDGIRTDEIFIYNPYHEKGGEFDGHLRVEQQKYWFS